MEQDVSRDEPIYRLWISSHQWALMQRGAVPLRLEKLLAGGQRLVVELAVDPAGQPVVHTATLEQRRRLRGYRSLGPLPCGRVVVHIEAS